MCHHAQRDKCLASVLVEDCQAFAGTALEEVLPFPVCAPIHCPEHLSDICTEPSSLTIGPLTWKSLRGAPRVRLRVPAGSCPPEPQHRGFWKASCQGPRACLSKPMPETDQASPPINDVRLCMRASKMVTVSHKHKPRVAYMSKLPSLRIPRNLRRQRGPRSCLFYTGTAYMRTTA